MEQLSSLSFRGGRGVGIESHWTARKRERMEVIPEIVVQRQIPRPCHCKGRSDKDGATSSVEMKGKGWASPRGVRLRTDANIYCGTHNSAKIRSMTTHPFSLLSGEEIESNKLVIDSIDKNLYRASTYDLSVGEIIPAGSASGGSAYNLPPGGTVRVVSKEMLKSPDGITGHALLKNELCRHGVLAINIGVVHSGFEGPLSSILINFGKGNFVVKQGDPFLRISFHRCPLSSKTRPVKYDRQQ